MDVELHYDEDGKTLQKLLEEYIVTVYSNE